MRWVCPRIDELSRGGKNNHVPRLTGVHHVTVPTSDPLGTDWYVQVFGFTALLMEESESEVVAVLLQHPCGVRLLLRRAAAPLPALRGFPLFGLTVPSFTELQLLGRTPQLVRSRTQRCAPGASGLGGHCHRPRPRPYPAANGRRTRRRRLGAWVPGIPAGDWAAGQTFGQAQGTLKRPHTSSIAQTFPGLRMRVRGVDDSPCPPVEFAASAHTNGSCVSQHASSMGPRGPATRPEWSREIAASWRLGQQPGRPPCPGRRAP